MLTVNFAVMDKLVDDDYLTWSEFQGFILYNYTKKCEFEQHWIPETLSARGTIFDLQTGKVVARAFDKFFNVNQRDETKVENLPKYGPIVSHKEDGSLGIGFPYRGGYRIATRGSFYSDQAIEANQMLNAEELYDMTEWPTDWTPLFEIIYPENRIITDYGQERKLVLIAARNIHTDEFMEPTQLIEYATKCGFTTPTFIMSDNDFGGHTVARLLELQATLPGDNEGYVARWGQLLVKFKGDRYMELARFKANLGPLAIWEAIRNKTITQLMEKCPDEFHGDMLEIFNKLTEQYDRIRRHCESRAFEIGVIGVDTKEHSVVKSSIHAIQNEPKTIQPILYAIMRGISYEAYIWKMLRPDNNLYKEIVL